MKIIYILLVFSIISCTIAKKSSQKNKDAKDNYVITKIKRIDNWYAIYAKKGDSLYKIISKYQSDQQKSCKIKKGKYYDLELHWALEKESPKVSNYIDITCYNYGPKTYICIEPDKGIFKLYYSPSIKGLCLINK